MNKNLLIITWSILTQLDVNGQSKMGFENYNYLGQGNSGAIVPMIHFDTKNNWHAEMRYNYEDVQTASFYAGKTFSGGSAVEFALTPMAGIVAGNFSGASLAFNTEVEWKNLYFSAQSQYTASWKKSAPGFVFSWSELGYNFSSHIFGGVALQYTLQEKESVFEKGLLAGASFGKVSIPIYLFNPFNNNKYWIIGITYDLDIKPKSKK